MGTDELLGDTVQLLGRDARPNVATHLGQRLRHQDIVFTQEFDLLVCFQIDHFFALRTLFGKPLMATLNPTGLHQTVVVTHQQVALDLLESVEHHTHHDQQRRTSVEVGERLLDAQELHRQRTAERAHFFLKTLFVERAHLLEQDYRILGKSAAVRIDSYMSGKVGLILLAGYRRSYNRRAEAIADIVLNYQHGSYPALLGADDGTQISVVYISPFYCHF